VFPDTALAGSQRLPHPPGADTAGLRNFVATSLLPEYSSELLEARRANALLVRNTPRLQPRFRLLLSGLLVLTAFQKPLMVLLTLASLLVLVLLPSLLLPVCLPCGCCGCCLQQVQRRGMHTSVGTSCGIEMRPRRLLTRRWRVRTLGKRRIVPFRGVRAEGTAAG
jgi:hypothetical protein